MYFAITPEIARRLAGTFMETRESVLRALIETVSPGSTEYSLAETLADPATGILYDMIMENSVPIGPVVLDFRKEGK